MKPRIEISPYWVLLSLMLVAMHLFNLELGSVGDAAPQGNLGAKPMHLIAVLMGFFLLQNARRVYRVFSRDYVLFAFLANGIFVSIGQAFLGLFSPVLFKLIFGVYCLFLGYDISIRVPKEKFLSALRVISWITLAAILIKAYLYLPELRSEPTRDGWKPEIPLFFHGGVNIEATMMVLASLFFAGRKDYFPFLAGALVVSVLYLSRGSTLGCLASVLLVQFNPYRMRIGYVLIALVLCLIGSAWVLYDGNSFFLSRLTSIGSDSSSSVRLEMLSEVGRALRNWPLGYGAGNAVTVMEASHGDFRAGNLHNVFAQNAVDFGIQGFILWIALIGKTIVEVLNQKLNCPLGLFVLMYFLFSSLQFTGTESFFWLIFGAFGGYIARRTYAPSLDYDDDFDDEVQYMEDPYENA